MIFLIRVSITANSLLISSILNKTDVTINTRNEGISLAITDNISRTFSQLKNFVRLKRNNHCENPEDYARYYCYRGSFSKENKIIWDECLSGFSGK